MYTLILIIFVIGYLGIAFEHTVKIDKAAFALITGVLCWTVLILGIDEFMSASDLLNTPYFCTSENTFKATGKATAIDFNHYVNHSLLEHLGEISGILFFLLGAMTIVELIDAHEGFSIITDKIKTTKKIQLLWVLNILTFFMSAALDNLTTSIVMATLLRKLIKDREDLWLFAGTIIISANAGGAWSPIGDVTTIMLWVDGQITAGNTITHLIIPSLVCALVPLIILSFRLKGNINKPDEEIESHISVTDNEKKIVLFAGVLSLLFVPVFKQTTHLEPFMGVLLGLGVLWVITEILHAKKDKEEKRRYSVISVLEKVDTPSVLFFLGILLAVASLQTAGHLKVLAVALQEYIGNIYIIDVAIGLFSSIVDNVPLVAGAKAMYSVGAVVPGASYPTDHAFWQFLAYCAGTGGSCLIIGSAAGVAIMGILKIDFMWYVKKVSLLALIGYLAGAGVYVLMYM